MYPLREEAIFAKKAKMLSSTALILPVRARSLEFSEVLSLSIADLRKARLEREFPGQKVPARKGRLSQG